MQGTNMKVLTIYIEDTDTWENEPLYEAIVRTMHRAGISGATVWTGIMGYGANGRIHRKWLFGVSDEKPVMIEAIDSEEKIRTALPQLLAMVGEGLVALRDVEVFVKLAP